MASHHNGLFIQPVQPLLDGTHDSPLVTPPQIGAANATAEQGVAGDQQFGIGEPEAHRTRGVARRMQCHATATGQFFVIAQPAIRCRYRRIGHAEHLALHLQVVPQYLVVLVQVQGGAGQRLELARGKKMIEVRVCMDDAHQRQAVGLQARQDLLRVTAWVDDDGFLGQRVANHSPHVAMLTTRSTCRKIWTKIIFRTSMFSSAKNRDLNRSRYNSSAYRVLIPQFRLMHTRYETYENTFDSSSPPRPDYLAWPAENGYYPNFPVIIQSNNEPWSIANLYLVCKLQREHGYESRTYRSIADHLLNYLRFLEDEDLNFLHLPQNNRLKVTFRYHKHLIELRDQGHISTSTASTRINAIARFYRDIVKWGIIQKSEIPNPPFDEVHKKIQITSKYGTQNIINVQSHNLVIPIPHKPSQAEYIQDGGALRPLTVTDQKFVLKALLSSSREYQLMFYLALFTGARIQTVGTLRAKNLNLKLDGDGNLRLPVGAGTLIDTKKGSPMTLLLPGWLVKDLLIYSHSSEAIKRRERSYYGDTEDNYLFLSKSGVPYYTSKKELYDRQNPDVNRNTFLTDRAKGASIQDGGSIRQHIHEILLPRILEEQPDFQSFRFHDLRATFGMNLLEAQLKHLGDKPITSALDYVQQRMGHRDKATTMQYLNYKSRLEWKSHVQSEYEQSLFNYVNIAT